MLQTVHNSEFSPTMDLFKEIDDLSDLLFPEKNSKLGSPEGGYEDLQSKYSSLHENYAKEIENSKKVETCLVKCLKFYSKLCKKYEMQQKIISNLEETIKEKIRNLEEAQRNEERLKGVIEVYRTERVLYAGQTSEQLREEKEMLLDVCCKLISESVRSNNTSIMSKLLLRKFRDDLSEKNIMMLKSFNFKLKKEFDKDFKQELNIADEFKSENKYSSEVTKAEMKEEDTKYNQFDVTPCKKITEESSCFDNCQSDETSFVESEQEEPVACSLPLLEEVPSSLQCTENEKQHDVKGDVGSDCVESGSPKPISETNNLTLDTQQEAVACSLPLLEEVPSSPHCTENEKQHEVKGDVAEGECVKSQNQNESAKPISELNNLTLDSESGHSDILEAPPSRLCSQGEPAKDSASIFDISEVVPNSDSRTGSKEEKVDEFRSDVLLEGDNGVEDLCFVKNTNSVNVDAKMSDEDSLLTYELSKIFREMSAMRVLSPIRESNSSAISPTKINERVNSLKRSGNAEENTARSKRFKSEEEKPSGCLLDSIMSAMSVQNEEFKSKTFPKMDSGGESGEGSSRETSTPSSRVKRRRGDTSTAGEKSTALRRTPGRCKDMERRVEKLVAKEIKTFVSFPISCKEDAERNVKQCVSVLANKPEDVIAKCIVAMVLENVDETVEIFERPAPPLTKTQHRLIVLLSVFRTLEWDSEKISSEILSIIYEKLFPDDFFWPDDSVEAVSRFYAALCRARNDTKTLWRFCLSAMTDMRQRCPILVFTVLKTWPDVLHEASVLRGNVLALTVVNILLNMPNAEGLRNSNQSRKLVALKHLLNNFYQFKLSDTIEGHTKKVLEGFLRQEAGTEKSVVLLAKCRKPDWTVKNVVPVLKSSLVDWSEGKLDDSVAKVILSVIKQISPNLLQESRVEEKVREFALCLTNILTSGKKSHDCEVNLIEALLQLKNYPAVRTAISEWIPKNPISDTLRDEIIDASTDKILRDLELNRGKKRKRYTKKEKQWNKPKGKKRKGKPRSKS